MNTPAKKRLVSICLELNHAKASGELGDCTMPEDTAPQFDSNQMEQRLSYFTLPMSLNYQRDSYALWKAALETWNDTETQDVFDVSKVVGMPEEVLRYKLTKHRLALQPNKHIATWSRISHTVLDTWGSFGELFTSAEGDFLKLREVIQVAHKQGFPYLSGPKIFNYWSSIISEYGHVHLENRQYIEVAPDTHVIKSSVILGVITAAEAESLTREAIALRWREALEGSGLYPSQVHSALWFWSRGGFEFKPESL